MLVEKTAILYAFIHGLVELHQAGHNEVSKGFRFIEKGKIKPKDTSKFKEGEIVAIVPIEEWLAYLDHIDSKYNNLKN